MNPEQNQLDRLFKAAAAAPRPAPTAAVFAQEARVLGNWRAALAQNDGGEWMLAAFRRAAIFGCLLAVATVMWNYHDRGAGGGAFAVADSVMQVGGVEP